MKLTASDAPCRPTEIRSLRGATAETLRRACTNGLALVHGHRRPVEDLDHLGVRQPADRGEDVLGVLPGM